MKSYRAHNLAHFSSKLNSVFFWKGDAQQNWSVLFREVFLIWRQFVFQMLMFSFSSCLLLFFQESIIILTPFTTSPYFLWLHQTKRILLFNTQFQWTLIHCYHNSRKSNPTAFSFLLYPSKKLRLISRPVGGACMSREVSLDSQIIFETLSLCFGNVSQSLLYCGFHRFGYLFYHWVSGILQSGQ